MSTVCLTFDPSGNGHCLYTEMVDLKSIGLLDIRRASSIEFNIGNQNWEVKTPEGELIFSHSSRAVCLDWEHQYFNR